MAPHPGKRVDRLHDLHIEAAYVSESVHNVRMQNMQPRPIDGLKPGSADRGGSALRGVRLEAGG